MAAQKEKEENLNEVRVAGGRVPLIPLYNPLSPRVEFLERDRVDKWLRGKEGDNSDEFKMPAAGYYPSNFFPLSVIHCYLKSNFLVSDRADKCLRGTKRENSDEFNFIESMTRRAN